MTQIQFYRTKVYGKEALYALGDEGRAVAMLTGKITITPPMIYALKILGHNFQEVLAPKA